MKKLTPYKNIFKEDSKSLIKKLLKDDDVIDAIMGALEQEEPNFIHLPLSEDDKIKLVEMIFSNKYTFKFISGEEDDSRFSKSLETYEKTWKTFNIEDNYGQIAAIFYK